MEKQEMLKIAKSCNFYQDKELKDLSGNTFVSFRNEATDLIFIYRDQKDGKFFLIGLFKSDRAKKLMKKQQIKQEEK